MKDKEFVVEKIRSQYMESEHTELDALKTLDAKVKKPAKVFGYIYGSIGAIVMGTGMSLVMTEIGDLLGSLAIVAGITVGIVGIVLAALAYPIYNRVLKKQRQKIAPEILQLSGELLR